MQGDPSSDETAERGLTMIEVLLATTASVIVVGALLTATVQQGRQRQMITESSLATSAILNNLERARTLSDAEVAALDGVDFDVPGPNGGASGLQPVTGDADGLPGELTVVVDRSAGGAVLYRVAAAVTWQGASGRRRMMLQTLLGERR